MQVKKRLLVVDDEPGIIKILRVKLGLHGYEVIATTSGAESVELARTQKPDIILLDILMPDLGGFEVLERIRAFSPVPVIVFTANPKLVEDAMKLGANDSVSKPFNPDHLVDKIRSILDGSQGHRLG